MHLGLSDRVERFGNNHQCAKQEMEEENAGKKELQARPEKVVGS